MKKYLQLYKKSEMELRIKVVGDSMMPTLLNGDYVSIRPFESYEIGDIVVYEGNVIVVHRIIDMKEGSDGRIYILKGDHNVMVDPPVYGSEIVGKVIRVLDRK